MSDHYSQGIMGDAAVILENGNPMTIEQIVERLNITADHKNLTDEKKSLMFRLENAEKDCRKRIKADRLYCMSHGGEVAQQVAAEIEELREKLAEARVQHL